MWALAVAALMSTRYLAQPFVWTNWPVDEVLVGWVEVLRDHALVALAIAATLVPVTQVPVQRPAARALLVVPAIVVGALGGEYLLRALAGEGPTSAQLLAGRIAQWTGLSACVAGLYYLWARQRAASAAARAGEIARSAASALAVRTQLQALRQQIDPHFLFNTLATIRELHPTDATASALLLHRLVAYLRSTMPTQQQCTTLGDEADLAASYLDIVAMRMSGRLRYTIDIPAPLRALPCPPLSIATLAENAVKHGITPAPDGGTIAITARSDGRVLEIVVADTGVGIAATAAGRDAGCGIGLSNLRARLRALHGAAASLAIGGNAPRGVRAVLRLPRAGDAH